MVVAPGTVVVVAPATVVVVAPASVVVVTFANEGNDTSRAIVNG